jgi:lipopolysaccharide transport system ATP-binding protein
LLDEVMAAGDIRFAEKARKRMFAFMQQSRILVFCSHNAELLGTFCDKTIWLHKGQVAADGPTKEVTSEYRASLMSQ